jgi:hypothetical protein
MRDAILCRAASNKKRAIWRQALPVEADQEIPVAAFASDDLTVPRRLCEAQLKYIAVGRLKSQHGSQVRVVLIDALPQQGLVTPVELAVHGNRSLMQGGERNMLRKTFAEARIWHSRVRKC